MRITVLNQCVGLGVVVDIFWSSLGMDGTGTVDEKIINAGASGHFVLKNKRQYFLPAQKPETRDH